MNKGILGSLALIAGLSANALAQSPEHEAKPRLFANYFLSYDGRR